MRHQIMVTNLMSARSPIRSLMVMHGVGTGKTLTACLAMINNMANAEYGMRRGLVLTPNRAIGASFKREFDNCFALLMGNKFASDAKLRQYVNSHYTFDTITSFANKTSRKSSESILRKWNCTFIVIDEAHDMAVDGLDYPRINRFLKVLKVRRLLLLTATPMRNSVHDLVPLHNFMRHRQANDLKSNVATGELIESFAGYVSYYPSTNNTVGRNVRIVDDGIVEHDMSALMMDAYATLGEDRSVAMLMQRQVSRFVFPDGTYGANGYKLWMNASTGKPTVRFLKWMRSNGNTADAVIAKVAQCSTRYSNMARMVYDAARRGEKSLVYDDLVTGSGLLVFAAVLEAMGMKRGQGDPRNCFVCLTRELMTVPQIIVAQRVFNSSDNVNGEQIAVIMGSRVIAEGLTFKNVLHEHVVAHWNDAETQQIIGRGIRIGAHDGLASQMPDDAIITVRVYRHASVYTRDRDKSIDLIMYEVSAQKKRQIDQFTNALRTMSVTCASLERPESRIDLCRYFSTRGVDNSNAVPLFPLQLGESFKRKITSAMLSPDDDRLGLMSIATYCKHMGVSSCNSDDGQMLMYTLLRFIQTSGGRLDFDKFLNCDGEYVYVTRAVDPHMSARTLTYRYTVDVDDAQLNTIYSDVLTKLAISSENYEATASTPRRLSDMDTSTVSVMIENLISSDRTSEDPHNLLEVFKAYYTTEPIGKIKACCWLAHVRTPPSPYRVLVEGEYGWRDANAGSETEVAVNMRRIRQENIEHDMSTKNTTHYGQHNPFSGSFCLKSTNDIRTQQRNRRRVTTGRVCSTYNMDVLRDLINSLGGDPSDYLSKNRVDVCRDIQYRLNQRDAVIGDVLCGQQSKRNK